ncbi:MAG: hypothetical protein QOK43_767 [Acidimicrobiaceae bacterium]|nr:hypothetical protein [Acidimicrobiaceae bacterium]
MTKKRIAAIMTAGALVLGGGVGVASAQSGSRHNPTKPAVASTDDTNHPEDATTHRQLENEVEGAETPGEVHGGGDTTAGAPAPSDDGAAHDANDDHGNDSANHGAAVSTTARSATPGPGHGAAVSAVARDNNGSDDGPNHDANDDAGEVRGSDDGLNHDANDDDATETDSGRNRGPGGGDSSGSGSGHGSGHSGRDD